MNDLTVITPVASLPSLVDRAAQTLANARTSAEVLEAKEMAGFAYDQAKRAARLAKAKDAHDELVAAAHRAQADALEIEAQAKRRLADEYDAAQAQGEVGQKTGRPKVVPDGNDIPPTAEDVLGSNARQQIHESRLVRDAEEADPGIVHRTLQERLAAGDEPTRAALREAVVEAAKRGLRGEPAASRKNPLYTPPTPQNEAMLVVSGGCRNMMDAVRGLPPTFILEGFVDDAQRARNLASIRECRDYLTTILEAADAEEAEG